MVAEWVTGSLVGNIDGSDEGAVVGWLDGAFVGI